MGNDVKLLVKGIPPPALDRELTVIGKPLDRRDAPEKVTGQAKYSGDIKLPGMLYAKILHCPHPRARITQLDTKKAEALPGVWAVLTKENTPGWRTSWYQVRELAFPESITHEGGEVAAVAAEDIATAQKALELIEVEYEVLPPRQDAAETLQKPPFASIGAEEYPGREIYDRKPFVIRRGNVEKGFEEADVIVEETYTTQVSHHASIQTRACVADWDGHVLTVWDAIQGLWYSKLALAEALGLDPENIRIIVNYLGGGFGSKAWSQRITFYAAKLAMMTGRPVKMEQTREEEFVNHPRRWDCKILLKMGAKKDGTLTAIHQTAIVNIGAAAERNYYYMQIIWHTANLHACPNVYLEQIGVYTNRQITGPTRSPLNMPAIFALESHMDRMAVELGMDPLEFRFKNYATYQTVGIEDSRDRSITDRSYDAKIPYSSKIMDQCMKMAAAGIGWNKRKTCGDATGGALRRGIGMASYIVLQGVGMRPYTAEARVTIDQQGTICLLAGVVDIGGGQQTILSMIAAEEIGVAMEDITVVYGDTKGTPFAPSCHSSRITPEMGPAVLQAAAQARQELFVLAAPLLSASADELQSRNGEIYVKANPDRVIPFKTACRMIAPGRSIEGSGSRAPNPAPPPMMATFGAQAVELEVDRETGEVNILQVAAAHDFGKAINPKLCISQVYGGIEFGAGYALTEEGLYDPQTGKLLTNSLQQYKIFTSLDFPPVAVYLLEVEDPYFAYSAKGAAENTNAPTPAAIRNALYNAIGIWFNDLPITPDKIITAIQEQKDRAETNAV